MTRLVLLSLLPFSLFACDSGIGGSADKDDTGVESDEDGDGFSGADDCDDTDPDIHVGADEVCDGKDNDCDAAVDGNDTDLIDGTTWYPDSDEDGFGDAELGQVACDAIAGHVAEGGDCDDEDATVNPSGIESCSTTADDDCDGEVNDVDAIGCITFYADGDGDGHGAADADAACMCFAIDDYSATANDDCDDSDGAIYPEATEICSDLIDQDCDGDWDECRLSTPGPASDAGTAIAGVVSSGWVGTYISAGPDVDGDGSGDMLLSAPDAGDGTSFLFTSMPTSDTTVLSADVTIEAASTSTLGVVRLVPDVSGDGSPDVVGLASEQFTGRTVVAVWASGLSGTLDYTDADLTMYDTSDTLSLADLVSVAHSSATADLFIQDANLPVVRVYRGSSTGAPALSDELYGVISGTALSGITSVPDLDGDGLGELAMQDSATGNGTVHVFLSSDVGVASSTSDDSWTLGGEDSGDQFGTSANGVGDLNGDGYDDFAVGAPRHDEVTSNTGSVYLFFGSTTLAGNTVGSDADAEIYGELRNDYAGTSVAGVGDMDADGNLDLVIGSPGFDFGDMDNPGAAYAVYGTFSGALSLNDIKGRIGGSNSDADLGSSAAGSADLDGDGYFDLIVGEPGHNTAADDAAGAVWVLPGAGL